MQVFIQTDRHIALTEKQRERFEQDLAKAMGHFDARLTRIEAHLSDVNSARGGDNDKRCLLEARPSGRQPLAVEGADKDGPRRGAVGRKIRPLVFQRPVVQVGPVAEHRDAQPARAPPTAVRAVRGR